MRFARALASSERTRCRVEELVARSLLGVRDAERVYEALFLRSVVLFESLLEEVFFGLLGGSLKSPKQSVKVRVKFASDHAIRDIVFAEKDYIEWLPIRRTEDRARRFFAGGKPFTDIDDSMRSELKRIVLTRNSIAHRSAFSRSEFLEKVIGSASLLPREKTPAGYLRGVFRTSPTQTRFELFAVVLSQTARTICCKKD